MRGHNHLFGPGGLPVVRYQQVENRAVHAGRAISSFFPSFLGGNINSGSHVRKAMMIPELNMQINNTCALLLYVGSNKSSFVTSLMSSSTHQPHPPVTCCHLNLPKASSMSELPHMSLKNIVSSIMPLSLN